MREAGPKSGDRVRVARDEEVRVVFDAEAIATRVRALGAEIDAAYAGRCPLLVSVLTGSFVFMADLARAITLPVTIDFMAVSSYADQTASSGVVRILKDLDRTIEAEDIVLVEDIVDSGRTLSYLCELLRARNPASLEICTLLDKPARREVAIVPRFVGFPCPDAFVVGYGLDRAQALRNLPFIAAIDGVDAIDEPAVGSARAR